VPVGQIGMGSGISRIRRWRLMTQHLSFKAQEYKPPTT
jgi:hypothetical protein